MGEQNYEEYKIKINDTMGLVIVFICISLGGFHM